MTHSLIGPLTRLSVGALLAVALGSAPILAQTSAATTGAKARTPESIECSKQADAKGLHGAERKKFREECKKKKG